MHALLLAAFLHAAEVDRAVELVMRTQHVAGLSLGIAHGRKTVYEQGYGDRDVFRHLPAQPQTVYRIGSLTKAFTAALTGVLIAHRRVALDAPVAQYVRPFPWGTHVTVADLLWQRSGIPSYTDASDLNPYAWYAPQTLLRAVANEPLAFPPGTRFEYSNTNYLLLGMIAQNVTHEPFEDALQRHVIAPLHLHHTRYGDQPGEALGYVWSGDGFEWTPPSSPAYAFSAAAVTSNVPDLLHFLTMRRAPLYGLLHSEDFAPDLWYASGNVNGYSAFEALLPRTGDALVILSNADRLDLAPLALDIIALLQPQSATRGGFGPPQNENPAITAQIRAMAERYFAPRAIRLLEFLRNETNGHITTVVYRVTLSDNSRFLLHAPLLGANIVGELFVTPL